MPKTKQRRPARSPVLPAWNLSDLYQGIDDPAIDKALAQAMQRGKTFSSMYKGKVERMAMMPRQLLKAIQEYEELLQDAVKPILYASLVFSADSRTQKHGAFYQRMQAQYRAFEREILFFDLELTRLDERMASRLRQDPTLKPYAHYLEQLFKYKAHRLSEAEEQLLGDKQLTGRSAFVRFFDEEESLKQFAWKKGGKTVSLSRDQILNFLHDPKASTRKTAAEVLTKGLQEEVRRVGFIFNTIVQDKMTDDRYRAFPSPEAGRHLENQIDQATVDAMAAAVTGRYSIVQDFYRFKKQVMGVKTLHDYDRYAPISKDAAAFSFAEAKETVLSAFHAFSPEYADRAKAFFENGWIDAAARPGKRGGAFCMYVTPDLHPYVLVNFGGQLRDVLILAHELGHGVHASFAREQSYLNFDHPLTVAETASIFGEMIVFDALRRTLPSAKEKFALTMGKIEDIFASVFRQIAMYRFEQDVYQAIREHGEQPPEAFNKMWRARQQEMFGSSVTLTSNYDVWWSYISHFFHTPFYVYAYAFGELLTLSLYAKYQKEGPKMTEAYLSLLRAGGSASPQTLLRPFGIDLSDKKFWEGGLDLIAEFVREAKKLHKDISPSLRRRG
jgi:oligoendopeptidase F